MSKHKMTDGEIIKALECCSASDCNNCPYDKHKVCGVELSKDALALINRQQAEIEKLNVELVGMRGACESYKIHYDNAQAEIKRLNDISDRLNDICTNQDLEIERLKAESDMADGTVASNNDRKQRERLREVLKNHCAVAECKAYSQDCTAEDCASCLADHIIADGWMRLL